MKVFIPSEQKILELDCLNWKFNIDTFNFLLNPLKDWIPILCLTNESPLLNGAQNFKFLVSLIGCFGFSKRNSIGWVIVFLNYGTRTTKSRFFTLFRLHSLYLNVLYYVIKTDFFFIIKGTVLCSQVTGSGQFVENPVRLKTFYEKGNWKECFLFLEIK